MTLVLGVIPDPSLGHLRRALAAATAHALSRGVTTVGDMGRGGLSGAKGHADVWGDFEASSSTASTTHDVLSACFNTLGMQLSLAELHHMPPFHSSCIRSPDISASPLTCAQVYSKAADESKLPLRIHAYLPLQTW